MDKIYNAHTALYQMQKDYFFEGKEFPNNQQANDNFMDIVARREAVMERADKEEPEVSTPMGGSAYTDTEWEKIMQNVDTAIDEMQERIRERERAWKRRERIKKEKAKKLKRLRFRVRQHIVHREISSNFYSVKMGANGTFVVNNKVTGHQYTFIETECRMYKDQTTSRIFLVSTEIYQTMKGIEVDEVLESMLKSFFEIDDLETEELTTEETP